MAPKNFKNMLKMLKRETSPAAKPSQDLHEKERELKALLQRIDLENPTNRLSAKKFKELNIEGVIRYAYSELKYPLIVEYDLTNLDNSMKYIISALEQSIKEGLEMTAEWACTALVALVRGLRTAGSGTEKDYADAYRACHTQFAADLELLIRYCIERDRIARELDEMNARHQERFQELEQWKQDFTRRRDAGLLDEALDDLAKHAHHPAMLSPDAKNLLDELNRMHHRKSDLAEIDAILAVKQDNLKDIGQQITMLRLRVSAPPLASPLKPEEMTAGQKREPDIFMQHHN